MNGFISRAGIAGDPRSAIAPSRPLTWGDALSFAGDVVLNLGWIQQSVHTIFQTNASAGDKAWAAASLVGAVTLDALQVTPAGWLSDAAKVARLAKGADEAITVASDAEKLVTVASDADKTITAADEAVNAADHEAASATSGGSGTIDGSGGDNTTTVYRVEGKRNKRIGISYSGDVSIRRKGVLYLNFGNEARAQEFYALRVSQGYRGVVIKTFEVPTSYLDMIRADSVAQSEAALYPERAFRVDTKYVDQFGFHEEMFDELRNQIIQGTGRILP